MYSKYDALIMFISAVIMAGISIGLYFLLKNKSEKLRILPFFIITIIIILMEVFKQIFELVKPTYNLWSVPLHISSISLYTFTVATFFKQNSLVSRIGWVISYVGSFTMIIGMFLIPNLIVGSGTKAIIQGSADFLDWHTVIYHNLIVLFGILTFVLKPYKLTEKDIYIYIPAIGIIFMIIIIVANITGIDYGRMLTFFGTNFLKNTGIFVYECLVFLLYLVGFSAGGFLRLTLPVLNEK